MDAAEKLYKPVRDDPTAKKVKLYEFFDRTTIRAYTGYTQHELEQRAELLHQSGGRYGFGSGLKQAPHADELFLSRYSR